MICEAKKTLLSTPGGTSKNCQVGNGLNKQDQFKSSSLWAKNHAHFFIHPILETILLLDSTFAKGKPIGHIQHRPVDPRDVTIQELQQTPSELSISPKRLCSTTQRHSLGRVDMHHPETVATKHAFAEVFGKSACAIEPGMFF